MKHIGILGGGQLGRMMALSAKQMGCTVATLDPTPDAPCAQVADRHIEAEFSDVESARLLASESDVVTFEFENISAETAEAIDEKLPQGTELLFQTQHRLREKALLSTHGLPVAPYRSVRSMEELHEAKEKLGIPFVLKTARFGYDGKGQHVVKSESDFAKLLETFEVDEYVAEKWLTFEKELSVIVVRSEKEVSVFPVSENVHENNILHLSIVPARVEDATADEAVALAKKFAEAINLIGTLAIELFLTQDGLIVNELAPRPHNSGHYTLDACETSQFEQHVRALIGLPLGKTTLLTPVVMVNILGEHVTALEEEWSTLSPRTKVHLYGKKDAKRGRKMGHLNILADSIPEALKEIERLGIWKEKVK
ncbi:5-(carboxyamino)imidazole ribonucleotide synthase [Exiguobacterium flavidum]|uniref:5-(carboxyamino)imidazole ribonucleotide synthase n=1 Tax=Exiguobacterium flavidum TaxID=2184695 RepID=UPI000DF8331A|nr:5-(carboxyamino)imidazole ribonucleotide synthase [Exiguobacterium flavidum]